MANSTPLDQPLNKGQILVRFFYSSLSELVIGLTNIAFLLLFTITAIMGTIEEGFTLFLFVPYIFAVIIGATICLFLWDWRKATLAYEQKGEVAVMKEATPSLALFFAGIACFFWGIYLGILGYNFFFSAVEFWQLTIRYTLLLLPGFILGPFQYFYLRHLNKVHLAVLAYEEKKT